MRFVLVHGAFHGAWCWEKVIPELRAHGHEAIAVDLPGHGSRHRESQSLAGYRQAVVEVLQPGDVLVGHSMGCAVVTMAADAFLEVRHVVYLAGPLPFEGMPLTAPYVAARQELDEPAPSISVQDLGVEGMHVSADGLLSFEAETATEFFFHDCSAEDAAWACSRLNPQSMAALITEPVSVPRYWAANIPRSFIRCADDRAFPSLVADSQIERLRVVPFELPGSHSPFLSRPAELVAVLLDAVQTTGDGPAHPGLTLRHPDPARG